MAVDHGSKTRFVAQVGAQWEVFDQREGVGSSLLLRLVAELALRFLEWEALLPLDVGPVGSASVLLAQLSQ